MLHYLLQKEKTALAKIIFYWFKQLFTRHLRKIPKKYSTFFNNTSICIYCSK